MSGRVTPKWRPPLAFVIGGTLAAVLCLPLIDIGYFRVAGNILGWWETSLLIAWMAAASTVLLAVLLWRLVLRPVYALTTYARAMKLGQGKAVPTQFGTPEFSELGQSVIDMGATLQNRAASLRAYADHVTHELKSPLTAISGAAELLQDPDLSPDNRASMAQTVQEAALRMELLLTDLHRHAAASHSARPGATHVADVLNGLVVPDLQLTVLRDGLLPISAEDLDTVLVQLAQNAAAHGATLFQADVEGQTLTLKDNGSGISQGNQSRIFDPFFTTRRAKGGTGMGLSIVRMLLEARGGRIALLPSDTGATFRITF